MTKRIRRYLETVRPALLRGREHDALWVGLDGEPLQAKGIQNMMLKRSKARIASGMPDRAPPRGVGAAS